MSRALTLQAGGGRGHPPSPSTHLFSLWTWGATRITLKSRGWYQLCGSHGALWGSIPSLPLLQQCPQHSIHTGFPGKPIPGAPGFPGGPGSPASPSGPTRPGSPWKGRRGVHSIAPRCSQMPPRPHLPSGPWDPPHRSLQAGPDGMDAW